MLLEILRAAGGLGIFLLGVVVMTQGLKALAGDMLRRYLARFTHSPLSGAITGTASTAVLQSSSATTVAAVGFVGAGLLTFPQALGIVFGANLGTTFKGWLVALIGFKLKLGLLVSPLILIGVLLKLIHKGRLGDLGLAFAGFGLIFVGITGMQSGMASLHEVVTPDVFPEDTWFGRIQLVAIGVLFTVITQSSSAGVATALTALNTGAISFNQAASMVIGMDVGTTITAALATIGGSVETRRTGYSHVIYNLLTGFMAFMLLTPFNQFLQWLEPGLVSREPELSLVAFHTSFNVLGVMLIVPFAHQFARMMERLISARRSVYTDNLDKKLLGDPAVALSAIRISVRNQAADLIMYLAQLLDEGAKPDIDRYEEIKRSIQETRCYIDLLHLNESDQKQWQYLLAMIHAIDHLQRLHHRCGQGGKAMRARSDPAFSDYRNAWHKLIVQQAAIIKTADKSTTMIDIGERGEALHAETEPLREQIMTDIASGKTDVPSGTRRLRALKWFRRTGYHVWRICHYLTIARQIESGLHKEDKSFTAPHLELEPEPED